MSRAFHISSRRGSVLVLLAAVALLLLPCLALPAQAQATTITWTHGTENYPVDPVTPNTKWSDPRNWSPEQVPGPGDHVIVARDQHGHYTICPGGSFGALEVIDCSPFSVESSLTVTEGTSRFTPGSITIAGTLTVYGTLINQADLNNQGGTDTVVNYGTIIGQAPGNESIGSPLYNYGTVTCDSGTLRFYQGGVSYSGSTIGGGAGTVALDGSNTVPENWILQDGSILAGGVEMRRPTTIPLAAIASCRGVNTVNYGAGFLGPGTLHVEPAATLVLSNTGDFDQGFTLDNDGTVVGGGIAPSQWHGGTFVDNSGVIDLQTDYRGYSVDTAAGRAILRNTGTITSQATGAYIAMALDNQGTISVPSGSLRFLGGTSVPATGLFYGVGPGRIVFYDVPTMTYELGSEAELQNVDIDNAAFVVKSGATVSMKGSSTIGGTSSVVGPGTLRVLPGATLTASGSPTFAGSLHFDNEGTFATTGTTNWDLGTRIDNGGTFDLRSVYPVQGSTNGAGTIVNTGTITKSVSPYTATLALPLDNRGTISSTSGQLRLTGGTSAPATGAFTATAPAEIAFVSGDYALGAGSGLSGTALRGATLTLQPSVTVPFNGTNTLAGAAVGGTGTALVPSGSSLLVTATTLLSGGLVLDQRGTLDFQGNYALTTDGTGAIVNNGTITKTAGMATSTINPRLTNNGLISVPTGRITLPAGALTNYDSAAKTLTGGAYLVTAPGFLRINDGNIATLAASVTLSGAAAKLEDSAARSALRNLASVAPAGYLALDAGQALTTVPLANQGYVWIGEAAGLTAANGAYTQAAGQTLLAAPSATLAATGTGAEVRLTGGFLGGCGTVSPTLANTGGYLRPQGATTACATLTVAGSYSQGRGGQLLIDILGPQVGGFDSLAVSGAASLDGVLVVTRLGGYAPTLGDSFPIITAASCSGTFIWARSPRRGRSLPAGFAFQPVYSAGGMTLEVVAAPAPSPSPAKAKRHR